MEKLTRTFIYGVVLSNGDRYSIGSFRSDGSAIRYCRLLIRGRCRIFRLGYCINLSIVPYSTPVFVFATESHKQIKKGKKK